MTVDATAVAVVGMTALLGWRTLPATAAVGICDIRTRHRRDGDRKDQEFHLAPANCLLAQSCTRTTIMQSRVVSSAFGIAPKSGCRYEEAKRESHRAHSKACADVSGRCDPSSTLGRTKGSSPYLGSHMRKHSRLENAVRPERLGRPTLAQSTNQLVGHIAQDIPHPFQKDMRISRA